MDKTLVTDENGDPDPDKWLEHMDDMRAVFTKHLGSDDIAFPFGYSYMIMEEFVSLRLYFWVTIGSCVFAVFLGAIVVPVSIRGAVIIALSALSVVVQLTA